MVEIVLVALFVSLLCSVVLTWAVRETAISRMWVSGPESDRHVHRRPIPRLGGAAVFASFVATLGMVLLLGHKTGLLAPPLSAVLKILLPATAIFALGLYDDFKQLRATTKFVVQFAAAVVLYAEGFRVARIALLGDTDVGGLVSFPLTVFWVLLITNALNLVDGLDGLAGGIALFPAVVICIFSTMQHNLLLAVMMICLIGGILGFLRFNFNPASIFLGDGGSLFIGFLLSAASLIGSQKSPTLLAFAVPLLALALPIMDVGLAVIRRFLRGRSLFEAVADHIHHRLLKQGFSHRHVVLVLYAVSFVLAALSLMLIHPTIFTGALVLFVFVFGVLTAAPKLNYTEVSEVVEAGRRMLEQKKVIENTLKIRHTAELLGRCEDVDQVSALVGDMAEAIGLDGFSLKAPAHVGFSDVMVFTAYQSVGKTRSAPDNHAWELTLKLVTSRGDSMGSVSFFRNTPHSRLLVDGLVLASVLPSALAEALKRTYAVSAMEFASQVGAASVSLAMSND